MKKSELVNLLDNLFNFNNQEDWDKCGCNEYKDEDIINIYCSLDVTFPIIEEAIKNKCNVLITHHPILINQQVNKFDPINKNNILLSKKLIENNILHICLHTCYDKYECGTSYQIFKSFKINQNLISNSKWINDYIYWFELNKPIRLIDLIKKINNSYTNPIYYIDQQKNRSIKSIAIGAGSCSSYINEIIKNNTDLFLTGDLKWHTYLDAYNLNLNIANINHYSELVFVDHISQIIENKYQIKCIKNNIPINIGILNKD